jgi:hypothetical protein
MPIYVQMDNSAAVEHFKEHPDAEEIKSRPLDGERIFEIVFPDGTTLREMIFTTMATYRKHQPHGNAPDDAPIGLVNPRWVRASDDQLQEQLALEYGITSNDIPAGFGAEHGAWERTSMPALKVGAAIRNGTNLLSLSLTLLAAWSLFKLTRLHLRTTATPIVDGEKVCKGCHLSKPVGEFGSHPSTADRLMPKCRGCETDRVAEYRKRKMNEDAKGYRLSRKIVNWLHRFGISHADYQALLDKQEGRCAICRTTDPGCGWEYFPVDHNHETGEVRGLLCNDCNTAIGRMKDDPNRVHRAWLYLLGIPAAIALLSWIMMSLRTTAGRDYQAGIMGNPSSTGTGAFASASYIGVTADLTAPAAGDTILPGEVLSGTLVRAQGAFGHTTGAASYTVSKLFVSDQHIIVNKIGLFNGPTGGAPFIETVLSAQATLNSGDQLQIVSTVTL